MVHDSCSMNKVTLLGVWQNERTKRSDLLHVLL